MKGVAVPYIIAIILGVAVIGLVGYWLFVSGSRLPTSDCENAQRSWCTQWFSVDRTFTFVDENDPGTRPAKPAGYPAGCAVVTKSICTSLGVGQ